MEITQEGKVPEGGANWWEGRSFHCSNCDAKFKLTGEDAGLVRSVSVERITNSKTRRTVKIDCPTCKEPVLKTGVVTA